MTGWTRTLAIGLVGILTLIKLPPFSGIDAVEDGLVRIADG